MGGEGYLLFRLDIGMHRYGHIRRGKGKIPSFFAKEN